MPPSCNVMFYLSIPEPHPSFCHSVFLWSWHRSRKLRKNTHNSAESQLYSNLKHWVSSGRSSIHYVVRATVVVVFQYTKHNKKFKALNFKLINKLRYTKFHLVAICPSRWLCDSFNEGGRWFYLTKYPNLEPCVKIYHHMSEVAMTTFACYCLFTFLLQLLTDFKILLNKHNSWNKEIKTLISY